MPKLFVMLSLLCVASAVLAASPMGFDEARELLNRTSFAASVDDINAFARLSRAQAVDRLLAGTDKNSVVSTPAPAWVNTFESPRRVRLLSEEERKQFR